MDQCDWVLGHEDTVEQVLAYIRELEEEERTKIPEDEPRNWRIADAIEEMDYQGHGSVFNVGPLCDEMKFLIEHTTELQQQKPLTRHEWRRYAKQVAEYMFHSPVFRSQLSDFWTALVKLMERKVDFLLAEHDFGETSPTYKQLMNTKIQKARHRLALYQNYPRLSNLGLRDASFASEASGSRDSSPVRH